MVRAGRVSKRYGGSRSAYYNAGRVLARYGPSAVRGLRNVFTKVGSRKRPSTEPVMEAPPRKRMRTAKYRTHGKYAGKFRKPKTRKRSIKNAARHGSEIIREVGGVVSDAEIVGILHGAGVGELYSAAIRAIYRYCYEKSGYCLVDWNAVPEVPGTSWDVLVYWHEAAVNTANITTSITTLLVGDTHLQIATKVADALLNACIAGTHQNLILDKMRMRSKTTSTENDLTMNSCVLLNDCRVKFSSMNSIVLQNRTLGATASDDQSDDVTNNPLVGRQWMVYGNTVRSRNNYALSATDVRGGSAYPHTGFADYAGNSGPLASGNKVAGPSDVRFCRNTSRVSIQPGNLRTSKVYWSKTMNVNRFLFMIRPYIQGATSATKDAYLIECRIGICRFFQFEKLCDTRRTGNQDISVGYECNQITGAVVVSNRAPPTRRITDVQAQQA